MNINKRITPLPPLEGGGETKEEERLDDWHEQNFEFGLSFIRHLLGIT